MVVVVLHVCVCVCVVFIRDVWCSRAVVYGIKVTCLATTYLQLPYSACSLQGLQVLHHREVTPLCCPEQWCPAIIIPRLLVHPLLT